MRSANGPEFTAEEVTSWLGRLDVGCAFVAPAPAWGNGYVEAYHDKLRDEPLSLEVLFTRWEAGVTIFDWIDHYKHDRRHAGLGNLTPAQIRDGNRATSPIPSATRESSHHQ